LAKIAENCDHNIDRRLGKFSPSDGLLTLGSSYKITEVSHKFGLLYSTDNFKHRFWQKMCLATFWVIFAQTHLAILRSSQRIHCT
jgi:hypothetical protein